MMVVILKIINLMSMSFHLTLSLKLNNGLNNMHQTNPELIQEIKEKYLVPPPNKKFSYNFLRKKNVKLNGQANQPILIDEKVFKSRIKNGFFIEAGAYDGEYFSNTLFFELKQRWTGLLIEPNPDAFKRLKKKHRKTWLLGNCLSTNSTPEIVDFDVSGLFGGIIHEGQKPGKDPTKLVGYNIENPPDYERRTIQVQCFPLFSILQALGNPTVHYLSLDVEGSEFQILKTIPFKEVDVKVINLEINHLGEIFPGTWEDILNYLETQGYDFHFKISFKGIPFLDAVFVKKGFLDELDSKRKIISKTKEKKSKSTNTKYDVKDFIVGMDSDCDLPITKDQLKLKSNVDL